jgi:hypothetical protein
VDVDELPVDAEPNQHTAVAVDALRARAAPTNIRSGCRRRADRRRAHRPSRARRYWSRHNETVRRVSVRPAFAGRESCADAPAGQRHQPVAQGRKVIHQIGGHFVSLHFCAFGGFAGSGAGTAITFRRGSNLTIAIADTEDSHKPNRQRAKSRAARWNKMALLPSRHSRRPSVLRLRREATKLRPRCLMRVPTQ